MYSSKMKMEVFDFIKDNGIVRGNIKLSNGDITNLYFNIKKCIISDPYFTDQVISIINTELRNIKYNTVAGIALGGVLISDRFVQNRHYFDRVKSVNSLNYIVVRENKSHDSTSNKVIGNLQDDSSIVIIEDVVTTGKSVISAIRSILQHNPSVKIKAVVSVIDRTDCYYDIADDGWFKDYIARTKNIKYISLFKQGDFNEKS